jgi:hypothetical protein
MKNVYKTLVNLLAFFFIVSLFINVLIIKGGNDFSNVILPALIFGVLVAALPSILNFFKIKESTGALLLGGLVVNFIYYFVGYYALDFFTIATGRVKFGFEALTLNIDDTTLGLIVVSLVSAALSVILEALSKRK